MSRAAKRQEQEGWLQLAAAKLANGQYDSLRKAVAAHNVPELTLHHRMKGHHTKKDGHTNQQALMPAAKSALIDHIRHCACSRFPLMLTLIQDYANTITHSIPGSSDSIDIRISWLQGFLLRYPSIWSHWSHCLDNAHLTGAMEEVVHQWFDCLAEIMDDYSVASMNIFNMDEMGFMFGLGASEQVVVPSGDLASQFQASPRTQESATVIKCIRSGSQVLPPLIITKGKCHTISEQQQMTGIPALWHFSKSESGWTNSELTFQWLETIFELNTQPLTHQNGTCSSLTGTNHT